MIFKDRKRLRLPAGILILLLGGAGCTTSDRYLLKVYRKSPQFGGFAAGCSLDGTYWNHTDSGRKTLSGLLLPRKGFGFESIASYDYATTITLKYDDRKRRLQLEVRDSTGTLHTQELKAKQKGTYLHIRRSYYTIPVPVLFCIQKEQKAILFKDAAGTLTAVYRFNEFGWVLFGAAAVGGDEVYRFSAAPPER